MRIKNILLGLICASALVATASAADETIAPKPPSPPEGWTDGYVLANGIRIHYWRTGGDKPTMIMAHGSSDNGMCWTNLAKELVDDYDIILPDARGHGLSDPNSADDPPDLVVRFADRFKRFCKAFCPAKGYERIVVSHPY